MVDRFSTYLPSPIGLIQIDGTATAITAVSFMDKEEAGTIPEEALPAIVLECKEQLTRYFEGTQQVFSLALAQKGTPFQQQTWQLLATIPYGKTISYLQLALQSGDPKATRAVANANGKNNIAIIVPCHRVIGSNQELTGYAGGLWRKKWLLDHENKFAHGVQTLF